MIVDPNSKAHKGLWRIGIWGQLIVVAVLVSVVVWDVYHPELKEQMIEQEAYKK